MSNLVIKYGDAISLQNHCQNWSGGYLATSNPDKTPGSRFNTVTVTTPSLRGEKVLKSAVGFWRVLSCEGKSAGTEVKNNDIVVLKGLNECDGGLLAVYGDVNQCETPHVYYRANTSNLDPSAAPALRWKIVMQTASQDGKIRESDPIFLINQYTPGTSFLDTAYNAHYDGELYLVYTSIEESRKYNTGLWRMNHVTDPCLVPSPQPDPCHKDDPNCGCKGSCGEDNSGKHCFKLPPNTTFGLTAYANTDAHKQTVKLYIDDNLVDTYNGKGLNNTPMNNSDGKNTKVYHSGAGNVCVQVEGDGKPCKLRYSDNTLDGKPGFATIGAESGSDDDYNDSVVVLNWPLT